MNKDVMQNGKSWYLCFKLISIVYLVDMNWFMTWIPKCFIGVIVKLFFIFHFFFLIAENNYMLLLPAAAPAAASSFLLLLPAPASASAALWYTFHNNIHNHRLDFHYSQHHWNIQHTCCRYNYSCFFCSWRSLKKLAYSKILPIDKMM